MMNVGRLPAALCAWAVATAMPSAIATAKAVPPPQMGDPQPPIAVLPPPEPIELSTPNLRTELLAHDRAVRAGYEKLQKALTRVYSSRRFSDCSKKLVRGAICAETNKAMSDALLSWVDVKTAAEQREYFLDRVASESPNDSAKARELLQYVTPEPAVEGLLALLAFRKIN